MKISANIEISNRNHAGLAANARKRPVYSSLAIGKLSGDYKLQYFTKNMGTPKCYNIKDNIERVFVKFINEGKSTIRFKSPPEDMIISHNDPKLLLSFLKILNKVLRNETILTTHVINPLDTKVPVKPKTSLIIGELKLYWCEFPRTLTSLDASKINLDDIGNKLSPLIQLNILDLSYNKLTDLPEYLGNLPISELKLSRNLFHINSNWNWMKKNRIQNTLYFLDLSYNEIKRLPNILYKFKNMNHINVESNQIQTLPAWIFTSNKLKKLNFCENDIVYLPATIFMSNSISLHVPQFKNHDEKEFVVKPRKKFPSLKSLAAIKIAKYRRIITNRICPESLIFYLFNNFTLCFDCKKPIYDNDNSKNGFYRKTETKKILNTQQNYSLTENRRSIHGSYEYVWIYYAYCDRINRRCSYGRC